LVGCLNWNWLLLDKKVNCVELLFKRNIEYRLFGSEYGLSLILRNREKNETEDECIKIRTHEKVLECFIDEYLNVYAITEKRLYYISKDNLKFEEKEVKFEKYFNLRGESISDLKLSTIKYKNDIFYNTQEGIFKINAINNIHEKYLKEVIDIPIKEIKLKKIKNKYHIFCISNYGDKMFVIEPETKLYTINTINR